jgi:hypothetical protein
MRTFNRTNNIAFVFLLGFLITSCSDNMLTRKTNKTTNSELTFTSRIPVPVASEAQPDNVAVCNGTEMSESSKMNFLKAQSMVYYDTSLQPRYNAIRVWIPQISADFADASRYHINFYKWKTDANGNPYFDKTKLQFRIERKADKYNSSGYMDSLNWGKMKEALANSNVDTTDMATIFTNYSFTVLLDATQISSSAVPYSEDQSVDYDVLKIAVYKDSNLIEQKDFLLPAFYAHPLKFAEGKPTVLQQLHPFSSDISNKWPGTHYAELFNANCF